MGTLLNVENLSVSLKAGNQERTVLSSVSLKVDEGEILGVVGEVLGFYKFIGAYLPANKAYYIVND